MAAIPRTSCPGAGPPRPSLPPAVVALAVSDVCCPLLGVHSFLRIEWAEYNLCVFRMGVGINIGSLVLLMLFMESYSIKSAYTSPPGFPCFFPMPFPGWGGVTG